MPIADKAAGLSLAALATLALFGCAGPRLDWTKPGASAADLQRDLNVCAAQASAVSPQYFDWRTMSVVSDSQAATRLRYSCMIAHGWQMTPAISGMAQ